MDKTKSGCWSHLPKLTLIITLGLATTLAPQKASAVDVFTDPVGFITLNVTGPGTGQQYSLLGLGMTQLPNSRGIITAAAGTTLTVNDAALTNNQLAGNANGAGYFIEITSGSGAGVQDDIINNTGSAVTTKDDISSLVTAGTTTYKIYPHWTIGSVFGANDETGLLGANLSGNADQILVINPLTGGTSTYYFRTNVPTVTAACPGGGCGWRVTTSASSNVVATPLYIEQGLMVKRLNDPGTNRLLVGAVKLGKTLAVINPSQTAQNYNLMGNVYPTTNLTLGASGLYTGSSSTGVKGANLSGSADQVLIPTGAGGFSTYYFRTNDPTVTAACPGGGCGWRITTSASADQSGVGLPLGGSVFILRQNTGSFNWVANQPFTQ